jgi:uncharacterized membrane protein
LANRVLKLHTYVVSFCTMAEADASALTGPVATTQDERTMAVLAHVLQVVGWWIAPLTIFVLKRDSRFTSFHALQALFLQILYVVLMGIFMVLWFAGFFVMIAHAPQAQGAPPPIGFFILMPLIWLGWMVAWAVMIVLAIVFGVKAGRGEWAEYPMLGSLARQVLKIGPGGGPAS